MSSKRKIHHALSSDARAQTLELLYKKPRDIEELAEKLKLQPVTVRHHIQALIEAGLLESYEERTGVAGRPSVYYKIAKNVPAVMFPQRRYQEISQQIIRYLLKHFGKEKTVQMMTEIGQTMAKDTITLLESTNIIKEWNPDNFVSIFVNKYLAEIGAQPELIQKSPKKVVYRVHNCLFREVSDEMPDLMCDVIQHQFSKSFAKSMSPNIQIAQTCCMGHGCEYCEQVVEWLPKKP